MSKSFKLLPGVKLNVGRKGISSTIGKRGLSVNTGSHGTFLNLGLPGTGIRFRKKLFKTKKKPTSTAKYQTHEDTIAEGAAFLGMIIGGIIFLLSRSFFWSFAAFFFIIILCCFSNSDKHQQ